MFKKVSRNWLKKKIQKNTSKIPKTKKIIARVHKFSLSCTGKGRRGAGQVTARQSYFRFQFQKRRQHEMKEGAETRRERETQRDVDEEGKATVCTTVERRKKIYIQKNANEPSDRQSQVLHINFRNDRFGQSREGGTATGGRGREGRGGAQGEVAEPKCRWRSMIIFVSWITTAGTAAATATTATRQLPCWH